MRVGQVGGQDEQDSPQVADKVWHKEEDVVFLYIVAIYQ